jgi:hypothetical protein
MYQLQHIKMPGVHINPQHKGSEIFQPDQMAVHSIQHGNEDDCDGHKTWPNHLRYDQAVSIGCGKIGTPGPFHNASINADMYDAFDWFAKNGKDVSFDNRNGFIDEKKNEISNIMPVIRILNGYNTTAHSKEYDITKKWRKFTLNDCSPPGSIDG